MSNQPKMPYDPKDAESIVSYAKKIIGKSLRQVSDAGALEATTRKRGSLGNAVELVYFGYSPNSNPEADFYEAGIELKTTPLKKTKKGELVSKERLVLNMINYMSVVDETWASSSVLKKCSNILLMAYLYEPDLNPVDYVFQLVELWSIPEEDLYTIRRDWEIIVDKVRSGQAHTISSGDTLYLEACTKAATGQDTREQPYSKIPAKPRAWAFKRSYMNTVAQKILDVQAISRDETQRHLPLSELVHQRFEKFFGYTEDELGRMFGILKPGGRKPKNMCALITKRILGVDADSKILEFEKAGIKAKTMRLKRNGVPKESVSFPYFDYCELAETDFENSAFLGYLEQKYLLVVFKEDARARDTYRLADVLFWQMPESDLPEAERCYEEMRRRVREGRADCSVRSTENRCCHVRPHGRNSADTCMTPYGVPVVKKCFWLNATYVGEEIQRLSS